MSEDGELLANSPEAQFYLAFIWLMQGEYDLFLKEWAKVTCEKITVGELRQFIKYGYEDLVRNPRYTPEHLAALCHFMVYANLYLPLTFLTDSYISYIKSFRDIPDRLKVQAHQELNLAKKIRLLRLLINPEDSQTKLKIFDESDRTATRISPLFRGHDNK